MVKLTFTLLLVFCSIFSFAQKKYSFDYLIEYEDNYVKESIKKEFYFLTNSKDNSYLAEVSTKDSLHFQIVLKHHDVLLSKVLVLKSDFFKAELLNIDCYSVSKYRNAYKYKTKHYKYVSLKDTLINNVSCSRYLFKSLYSPKKKIKKGVGEDLFIIPKSGPSHLPILWHETAFEEWKLNKNIPNGIYYEKIFIDYLNEIQNIKKLEGYYEIDKTIIIEKACDDYIDGKIKSPSVPLYLKSTTP